MKIGYVRVSSEGQNIARQEELMDTLGAEQLFVDVASGKSTKRPQLDELLAFIREGDTVVVESISRLSRNVADFLNLIEIFNNKGVTFISQKETIDTSTPTGKFLLVVIAGMSELERENILQRQREGIEIAKREGKYKGRKPLIIPDAKTTIDKWRSGSIRTKDAIQSLGVSKSTFYRLVQNL